MNAKILFTMILLVCMSSFRAPMRLVSGRVTSAENGAGIPGINVLEKGTVRGTITDVSGRYQISISDSKKTVLAFSLIGLVRQEVIVGDRMVVDVQMVADTTQLSGVVGASRVYTRSGKDMAFGYAPGETMQRPEWNTEEYEGINENIFHGATQNPLSTFSIDVDAASYSNVRRFIRDGEKPPTDAVRIEEMVNYFEYSYPEPRGEDPFSIFTEIGASPWNAKHKLVHIGLQGKHIPTDNLPPSNLVFLIDVSGSMDEPLKLPLLKASLRLLINQLRSQDRLSIVVYAGAAGLVLPATHGNDKMTMTAALENLEAGGSTAGGAGIQLAYKIAKQNLHPNGNNRVILATDGDFNVGESSNAAMERLIEQKREDGIFLTVLGFGTGNYKDSKMETLADKGNGNYAYIDNILEAQKVLVNEFGGTLFTIAKDVKLQVEFNPARVKAWRLIGYENRVLRHEDFNNDKKDAGELGAGHTVTAMYEIIPQGVESDFFRIDELKYQKPMVTPAAKQSDEWLTVKFRYKTPAGSVSKLLVQTVSGEADNKGTSDNFRWSAAVASFGMLLRESPFAGTFTYRDVLRLTESSMGPDKEGYRAEFVGLVKSMDLMQKN